MNDTKSEVNRGETSNSASTVLQLLRNMSDGMMQSNAGSGRWQNNQNGPLPTAGQDPTAPAQQNRQQSQMTGNTLSPALPGDQLSALQALLGMNTNTANINPNMFTSSLGLGSELELKLRQFGMHPSQQRQQPSQLDSMIQSSRTDAGDDNSGKVSVPSRSAVASTYSSRASIGQPGQTKRVVRVPCRARGMSMDHNFQTAYFEISGSMQHGDGLICSFPECRNRGIKFLYCAFCKDPVAKRNFRNRHTHEDNVDSSDRPFKMQKMTKSVPSSRPNTNAPNASKAPHEVSEGAGSSNNGSGEGWPSNSNLVSRQTAMLPRKRPHYLKESQKRSTTAAAMSSETDTTSQEKSARVDTKRVDAWTMLLAERPSTDQSDAMSKWLMKVMAISDLKKSTAQAIAVAKASNSDMGSSNEGSNDGASPGDESSPTDDSSPTESSSDDLGQNVKKMPSSKPTSSNDASNEDSSPTNSNDSSNDSSSDNQDEDMDIKEIWIRD